MQDDNELYELDKKTANEYALLVVVPERTAEPEVRVQCGKHNYYTERHYVARVRNPWDILEFIEQHEHEHHGGPAAPVPYLPMNPADATAVLPVVTTAPMPPAAVPAVHVVAVPNGNVGAVLPGPALQLRHRSARPVVVRSIRLADGSHLVTLPADGFIGATWEIRVQPAVKPEPKHTHPHLNANGGCLCYCSRCVAVSLRDGTPRCCCPDCTEECSAFKFEGARGIPPEFEGRGVIPAVGPAADVCGRCGGWVQMDQARAVLPPPYGSLNAMHPLTLCGSCNDGLVELVARYVRSEPAPATGPAVVDPIAADKCPNCLASTVRCNANGCGQRQAPGWRVAEQMRNNGMEVRG